MEKDCYEQVAIMDELCKRAEKLRDIADSVRSAIEQSSLHDLVTSKREYDQIREQILDLVNRLSVHRKEHGC
jgi:hypothetical protein